jgi:hypothetical protein
MSECVIASERSERSNLLRHKDCFVASLLAMTLLFSGCMQLKMLPYLDQALALQAFGKEKDAQHKYIKNADAKFDQLLAALESGDIQKYKTQKDVIKTFGPPLLAKNVAIDGKDLKQALYRYTIQNKGPKKAYLYYDQQEHLVQWESL